jgi:hypothetical protein
MTDRYIRNALRLAQSMGELKRKHFDDGGDTGGGDTGGGGNPGDAASGGLGNAGAGGNQGDSIGSGNGNSDFGGGGNNNDAASANNGSDQSPGLGFDGAETMSPLQGIQDGVLMSAPPVSQEAMLQGLGIIGPVVSAPVPGMNPSDQTGMLSALGITGGVAQPAADTTGLFSPTQTSLTGVDSSLIGQPAADVFTPGTVMSGVEQPADATPDLNADNFDTFANAYAKALGMPGATAESAMAAGNAAISASENSLSGLVAANAAANPPDETAMKEQGQAPGAPPPDPTGFSETPPNLGLGSYSIVTDAMGPMDVVNGVTEGVQIPSVPISSMQTALQNSAFGGLIPGSPDTQIANNSTTDVITEAPTTQTLPDISQYPTADVPLPPLPGQPIYATHDEYGDPVNSLGMPRTLLSYGIDTVLGRNGSLADQTAAGYGDTNTGDQTQETAPTSGGGNGGYGNWPSQQNASANKNTKDNTTSTAITDLQVAAILANLLAGQSLVPSTGANQTTPYANLGASESLVPSYYSGINYAEVPAAASGGSIYGNNAIGNALRMAHKEYK